MTASPSSSSPPSAADADRPVCVVTGSSSGIGAATARLFARHGHDVVINYSRDPAPAEAVAADCRAAGASVLVLRADVSDDGQCRALAEEVRRAWGRVDVLVNNAGTLTRVVDLKDLDTLTADDFLKTTSVNVVGTFQMSRALRSLMAGRPHPSIVNISSMAAVMGTGSSLPYAVSKGAVDTLTLGLARALAPEVRVNAILPGYVSTDWLAGRLDAPAIAARRDRYAQRALLHEVIDPEDVARTALWLAGATKLTGQLVQLDAGFRLG